MEIVLAWHYSQLPFGGNKKAADSSTFSVYLTLYHLHQNNTKFLLCTLFLWLTPLQYCSQFGFTATVWHWVVSSIFARHNRRWQSTSAPAPAHCNTWCWIAQCSRRRSTDPLLSSLGMHLLCGEGSHSLPPHVIPILTLVMSLCATKPSPKAVVLPSHAKWVINQCPIPSLGYNPPGSVGWKHTWPTAWTKAP